MASALTLQDLPALADYTREREHFRAEVLSAKKARYVPIGENVSLLFESRLTVLYQVMEMLRIEKTTDPDGIQSELDAYNPMIPGGADWRATMLIEFADAAERAGELRVSVAPAQAAGSGRAPRSLFWRPARLRHRSPALPLRQQRERSGHRGFAARRPGLSLRRA